MFALIDCNNFYASCERLFRPDLRFKPIIVLSNNDGCVIARSNEAKAFGIKMGEPYFKLQRLCKKHDIAVFSSNYALYGDLSNRVMTIIESEWPILEIYSIDEAFLDLTTLPAEHHEPFCLNLQKKLLKEVGIPVSIGIGKTKTLSKLANQIAKKELKTPVFNIKGSEFWLKQIAIKDIWGIGRAWSKQLSYHGINTACDLSQMNAAIAKKQYNVILMRTIMELQGIRCIELEESQTGKSIISSKSFGQMQTEFENLAKAVAAHCASAFERLRKQNLAVQTLAVFVQTNRFREDLPQYNRTAQFRLISPTDDLRLITKIAKQCLNTLFKPGYQYKKAGVCFNDLIPKQYQQLDMWHQASEESLAKKDALMKVYEKINQKYGKETIRLAAAGFDKPWAMRANLKSQAYTTRWAELPIVRLN